MYVEQYSMYDEEAGNYSEVMFQFAAHTLSFDSTALGRYAQLFVQIKISDNTTVLFNDNYKLNSPYFKDDYVQDFYDIRKYPLKPGQYKMEMTFTDAFDVQKSTSGSILLKVEDKTKHITFSPAMAMQKIVPSTDENSILFRNGFEMLPYFSNYFPTELTVIPTYFEMYNPQEVHVPLILVESLKNKETGELIPSYTKNTRLSLEKTNSRIINVKIDSLETGSYTLRYHLLTTKKELVAFMEYDFDRYNEREKILSDASTIVLDPQFQKSISEDSVQYYLASLIPISGTTDALNIKSLLKKRDSEASRKYLQSYWVQTTNNKSATEAWLKYKHQVVQVQKTFGTSILKGFETDRGRVYLQYGSPSNIIVRESSPSEYPYEIWQFDKIKNFSNKRFIFYNPDLVGNHYVLLHSDMIGELNNYRWEQALSKRNSANYNIDDPNDGNSRHYGGNSRTLFEQK